MYENWKNEVTLDPRKGRGGVRGIRSLRNDYTPLVSWGENGKEDGGGSGFLFILFIHVLCLLT